mmetsp:Transcript_84927/g.263799  ORF Transcript_84927/g.263799 Transcript_84927/m.263799 type:complete len:153 (-) Transcript_84927:57-515(-)
MGGQQHWRRCQFCDFSSGEGVREAMTPIQRRLLAVGTGAAGLFAVVHYLFAGSGEESDKTGKKEEAPKADGAEKMSLDELDPEERKLVEEIKKKGYYHGRPKSSETPAPTRIDGPVEAAASSSSTSDGKRTEFDDFQKKWDKFGDEKFVKKL